MKDNEIFGLLQDAAGLSSDVVSDYRPCNRFYADGLDIPHIPDAILVSLKNGGGQLIYIPEKDVDGNLITSRKKPHVVNKPKRNADGSSAISGRRHLTNGRPV